MRKRQRETERTREERRTLNKRGFIKEGKRYRISEKEGE